MKHTFVCLYRVPTLVLKSNSSTFQAFVRCIFKLQHITAVEKYTFIYNTNCIYSLLLCYCSINIQKYVFCFKICHLFPCRLAKASKLCPGVFLYLKSELFSQSVIYCETNRLQFQFQALYSKSKHFSNLENNRKGVFKDFQHL